ncbi:MAG: alkaline phosphatase [Ignavibacteria bacterium]|nr:alkaline phosphatase [Ignavibacteria bacterium]
MIFRSVVILFLAVFNLLNAQNVKPKNIIILIGDGMGINYVGASLLQDTNSPFKEFTTIGLSITCSADKLITDSAAGATAIATGYLTNNKYISVDTLGNPLYTIFEHAEKLGLSTGIVVTASIAHATPGAFLGHSISRYDQTLIASQMVEQNFDVIIGGGLKYFIPKSDSGEREDNRDLTAELINKNYAFSKDYSDLKTIPDSINQIYGLLEMDGLPESANRNYTLGDLTKIAINHLKNDEDGFILMIEGSQIDWAGHDHKSKELLEEMKDFSSAIKQALDFAKADSNTLVLITSDHETGGMFITKGNRDASELELSFSTGSHTPSPVGIFAFGPGEELFKGIMNINIIGQKLFYLLDPNYKF